MMRNTLKTAAFAGLLVAGSASAQLITVDSVTGIWTEATPTGDIDGIDSNQISWGDPANSQRSSYVFDPADPLPSGIGIGERFDLGIFTHNNFPIFSPFLETAKLQVTTALTINGTSREAISVFDFDHWETPNNEDPCADGGALGEGINANGCADQVTFTFNQPASESFEIDGDWYILTIAGFEINDELADVLWTMEDASTDATLRAVITRPVPTPATLPLLGAGLLLLGLTLRRREAVDTEQS